MTASVNLSADTLAKVSAHAEARVALLTNVARSVNGTETSVTAWARAELIALRDGLTDRDAIQAAVVEKFPQVTGTGKVSKTPNGKFRTHWNRFCLAADVLAGESKTYDRAEALAMVHAFLLDTSKQSLFDLEQSIKADKAAADKAAREALTEEDKAKAKAAKEASDRATVAGIMVNDSAMIDALAARLLAMEPAEVVALRPSLAALSAAIATVTAKADAAAADAGETANQPVALAA